MLKVTQHPEGTVFIWICIKYNNTLLSLALYHICLSDSLSISLVLGVSGHQQDQTSPLGGRVNVLPITHSSSILIP